MKGGEGFVNPEGLARPLDKVEKPIYFFQSSKAEAECAVPAGASVRMGRTDPGMGLALEDGGDDMWLLPFSVTLTLRKTRTSWSIAVRVNIKK